MDISKAGFLQQWISPTLDISDAGYLKLIIYAIELHAAKTAKIKLFERFLYLQWILSSLSFK
jgi:hypothetical protein